MVKKMLDAKNCNSCSSSGKARKKRYKFFNYLRFTKVPYIFANNSKKQSERLIFFGCNFPGYYPQTTEKLIKMCEDKGIDFSIDCCGKPLYEVGDKKAEIKAISHLANLFKTKKTKQLITACPNCFDFLQGKVKGLEVISIFDVLKELGVKEEIKEDINIFYPCPERGKNIIFKKILPFLKGRVLPTFNSIKCCGMSIEAKLKEKKTTKGLYANKVKSKEADNIYTYCATCSGNFHKYDCKNIKHLVSELVGVKEKVNNHYYKSVLKMKFFKRRDDA